MERHSHKHRTRLIVLCVLLGALAGFAGLRAQARNTIKTYTLRVDAASADTSVTITGMYWVEGSERRVEAIRQKTPFETRVTGDMVVAIVKAEDGRRIHVALTESGLAGGSSVGTSVVVVQGLAPNVDWGFIKAF